MALENKWFIPVHSNQRIHKSPWPGKIETIETIEKLETKTQLMPSVPAEPKDT